MCDTCSLATALHYFQEYRRNGMGRFPRLLNLGYGLGKRAVIPAWSDRPQFALRRKVPLGDALIVAAHKRRGSDPGQGKKFLCRFQLTTVSAARIKHDSPPSSRSPPRRRQGKVRSVRKPIIRAVVPHRPHFSVNVIANLRGASSGIVSAAGAPQQVAGAGSGPRAAGRGDDWPLSTAMAYYEGRRPIIQRGAVRDPRSLSRDGRWKGRLIIVKQAER
jgi:hypothetical protein